MRMYGGLDTYDLVDTGRWADPDSGLRTADIIPLQQASPARFLAPAIYDEALKLASIQQLLDWVVQEYPMRAASWPSAQHDQHRKAWIDDLLFSAALAAPTMKSAFFEEEEEWRIITLALENRSWMSFLPKLTGLVPYVEFHYNNLPIQVVWSGPGRMTDQSLLAARYLLEKHSYFGVDLKPSKIPYRVG